MHLFGSCFHFIPLLYKSGKFNKESRNNESGTFAPVKGAGCFFLILIPGFTRAKPKDKRKVRLCPFFMAWPDGDGVEKVELNKM